MSRGGGAHNATRVAGSDSDGANPHTRTTADYGVASRGVGHGRRVLLVNDSALQLRLHEQSLRRSGFAVRTYESASVALLGLESGERPDLIATDICMPELDGWQFCHLVRTNADPEISRIPILVISAKAELTEEACEEWGATAALTAPFGQEALTHSVLSTLAKAQAEQSVSVVIIGRDPATVRAAMESFLGARFAVRVASAFDQADAMLAAESADLLVLDDLAIDAAGVGWLRTHRMSEDGERTAVIVLTGDLQHDTKVDLLSVGVDDVLCRSTSRSAIHDCAVAAMYARERRRELSAGRSAAPDFAKLSHAQASALRQSSDPMFIFRDGRVIGANTAAAALFALSSAEAFGSLSLGLLSPPSQPDGLESDAGFRAHLQAAYNNPLLFSWRFIDRESQPLDCEVRLTPISEEGQETVIFGVVRH